MFKCHQFLSGTARTERDSFRFPFSAASSVFARHTRAPIVRCLVHFHWKSPKARGYLHKIRHLVIVTLRTRAFWRLLSIGLNDHLKYRLEVTLVRQTLRQSIHLNRWSDKISAGCWNA